MWRIGRLIGLLAALILAVAAVAQPALADEIAIASIAGIGHALIQARIASGLTQAALAERVGLKTAAINRYEANDYQSANLTRLQQIAEALDFDLHASLQRH